MPPRLPDTHLASTFTPSTHTHPASSPSLSPQTNTLPPSTNVLIIGASRGIGAAIALAYARAHTSHLLLASRPSSSAEQSTVQRTIQQTHPGVQTHCFAVDITCAESVARLARDVSQAVRKVDVVVLNSGYSGPVVLDVTSGNTRNFRDVVDVNVLGTYHVLHYFVPLLKASSSEKEEEKEEAAKMFIAVGSFAGLITKGHIANTAYCVGKFAQARVLECVAEQCRDDGVCVVAVHPGAVLTEMADRTAPESFREYLTDGVGLCGAFCVWLSREKRMWLSGRLVSAKWDVDELEGKREDIEEGDLLKFGFRIDRGTNKS